MQGAEQRADGYVKARKIDWVKSVRNHRVFLRQLTAKPGAAAALVVAFLILGTGVLLVRSRSTSETFQLMLWVPAVASYLMAAWITFAVMAMSAGALDSVLDEVEAAAEGGKADGCRRDSEQVEEPVLMLDIDGVLHRGQTGTLVRLAQLQDWLRLHPEVLILISSDWRYSHSKEQLIELFDEDIQPRILGLTPKIEGAPREREIGAALEVFGIKRWAALDDEEAGFPTMRGRLVLTDGQMGLSARDLEAVESLLGLREKSV